MKKILAALFFIFHFSFFIFSQSGIISTVAGENIGINVTDTLFGINSNGAAPDNKGNVYLADGSNRLLRVVNLSTGIMTVAAGTGSYGYAGDSGDATNALFNYPVDVVLDSLGNLYIDDESDNVIREVTISTGIITTFAGNGSFGFSGDGGPATAAQLASPNSISFDKYGNMYIADSYNNRIRLVNGNTGIITTVAGKDSAGYNGDSIPATAAKLNYPRGAVADKAGNIYIADESNCRIRMVKALNDTIYTFAGNGKQGFKGNGGLATAAELNYPCGITLDTAGNIYISDTYNAQIREINNSGIISTYCGIYYGSFSGDGGPATSAELNVPVCISFDNAGDLFIADEGNRRIREVTAVGYIYTVAGNGFTGYNGNNLPVNDIQLVNPANMAVDSFENIYIADAGNNIIRLVDAATGMTLKVAGNGYAGNSGDNGPALKAEFNNPNCVTYLDSNLYIADLNNNKIREVIGSTNTIITVAGTGNGGYSGDGGNPIDADLWNPADVVFDNQGNMFIADMANDRIREVFVKSKLIKTLAGNGYNAKNYTGGFSGDGAAAVDAELNYPQGITLDDSDNCYIADTWNDRIRKVEAKSGKINTIAGNGTYGWTGDGGPATAAELGIPVAICFDPSGKLYFADYYTNVIRQVDLQTGIINTVAGNSNQGFEGDGGPATEAWLDLPHGLAFDPSGNMFIADLGNDRIRKVAAPAGERQLRAENEGWSAYPNPSEGIFTLSCCSVPEQSQLIIEIYTISGSKVYSKEFSTLHSQLSINLVSQPDGIYFFRVLTEEKNSISGSGKILILR